MRIRRGALRLQPAHRAPSHVAASLDRLRRWLEDDGWRVTVDETTLRAEKRRRVLAGVLYRNFSPVERASRGTLTCRVDCADVYLRFRPAWLPALVDAALLSGAYEITQAVKAAGSWADLGVVFLITTVVLPTLIPPVRFRFVTVLARAVWSSDDAWTRVRRRAGGWRLALNIGGFVAFAYPVLWRALMPFLAAYVSLNTHIAAIIHGQRPSAAAELVVFAVLATGVLVGIGHFMHPKLEQRD